MAGQDLSAGAQAELAELAEPVEPRQDLLLAVFWDMFLMPES